MNGFQLVFGPLLAGTASVLLARAVRIPGRRRGHAIAGTLALGGAALVFHPPLASAVAKGLGIGRGTDLVLYLAVLAGLYLFLLTFAKMRRLEFAVTELARRAALREAERCGAEVKTPAADRGPSDAKAGKEGS